MSLSLSSFLLLQSAPKACSVISLEKICKKNEKSVEILRSSFGSNEWIGLKSTLKKLGQVQAVILCSLMIFATPSRNGSQRLFSSQQQARRLSKSAFFHILEPQGTHWMFVKLCCCCIDLPLYRLISAMAAIFGFQIKLITFTFLQCNRHGTNQSLQKQVLTSTKIAPYNFQLQNRILKLL